MALSSKNYRQNSNPDGATAYVIQGDSATYQVKEELKDLGLQWDPEREVWWTFDKEDYSEALHIVEMERGFRSPNQTNMFD